MPMATNSETPKDGGSGGGGLEKRVTDVETRLTVIEKTMVTAEVFQRELGAFRGEMRVAFDRLRDEMLAGFDELRRTQGALRNEMHVGFGDLRKEMQAQDGALRDEMHLGTGELRKDMEALNGALRVEIAKTPFETFKWLLTAAGLAAAIATAIYNIWFR